MESADLVLAADLGGSATKLGLVDGAGRLVASALRPLEDETPAPGRSELDPDHWLTSFTSLARDLVASVRAHPAAIALTGATRCEVLVDTEGRPLGRAILFRDRRAVTEAEELAADPAWGGRAPIDASHPLARLLWLSRHDADRLARARWTLEPKDWLGFVLTGVPGRDPIAAARLEAPAARAIARRLALPLALLPPVRPLGVSLGRLRAEPARAIGLEPGTPVIVAPMDAWCATLAIGALAPGRAYASAGSSEVVGLIVDRPVAADGLLCPPWGPGLWHLGGPSLAGGAGLDWLARLLGRPVQDLLAEAGERPPDDADPLCHPWLAGERLPVRGAELRAALWGLESGHGAGHLVRAWLEALAFWDRLVLERAEAAAGLRAAELRLTGGLAAAPLSGYLRAAALARPVLVFADRAGALAGAAALAWIALGRLPDLEAARDRFARPTRRLEAEPAAIAAAERRYRRWLSELDRRLAEASG